MSGKCPVGKIKRVAYTRKNGTRVAAKCVKDMGAPGKGPKTLPPIKDKGFLTSLGYHLKLTSMERRKIIKKAVRKYGGLAVIRHINLVRNYNKNNKIPHQKYTSDLEYASELYRESKK